MKLPNEELLNLIRPVGSLYWSSKSTEPSVLFGGTWKRVKDVFILAAGDNYEAGKVGGEATHKLTTNEMPSHTHTFIGSSSTTNNTGAHKHTVSNTVGQIINCVPASGSGICMQENPVVATSSSSGSHSHTVTPKGTNSNTGGGQAHNNMPPYITYYCWERTA